MTQVPTIGFISAPAWFDPAPAEFPTVCQERVRTQQAPLLLPDFDYKLPSIPLVRDDLNLCARSLKSMGCDLAVQVGSPFAWAGASSESEARDRCDRMSAAADLPVVMTSLAIIDGLRSIGARRVSADCTYYDAPWRDAFVWFLKICGFEVVHASNLADQGLAPPGSRMEDFGWAMTDELAMTSVRFVAEAAPQAEALIVTGAGTRTLNILTALETETGRPIAAADTIVYWAAARALGLTLKENMGRWAKIK